MRALISLALTASIASALQIDTSSIASVKSAADTIAATIIGIYDAKNGSQIPGLFPSPYYWYEGGMAWDSLINYWALTGNDTYNDQISEALVWQLGDNDDYLPANQTKSEGNDDQSTWALAAMTAAENGFPAPKASSGISSWIEVAENVFNEQVARWDDKTCNGGIRWQIFTFNVGYTYKNSLSNGNFMQLAARLAAFTGNQTYADWATKSVQWAFDVGLIANETFDVYDGASTTKDCKQLTKTLWTANFGTYLSGYAYLSNADSNATLYTQQLLDNAIKTFAPQGSILDEVTCVSADTCTTDQLAFRAILSRALANVKYVDTNENINLQSLNKVLQDSAQAAAASCSGGASGSACGSSWTSSKYDGSTGLSQELSALEIILANIPRKSLESPNGTSAGGSSGGSSNSTSGGGSPVSTGAGSGFAASTFGLLSAIALAFAFVL